MREAEPGLRVVIVSGFDRKAMEPQVIQAGADAYLQKGTTPEETLRTLYGLFPQTGPDEVPAPRVSEEAPLKAPEKDTRLVELEADMEQLLYVVSHDLSEPVHVIKGFAERLARRAHSEEEGEFCEFILEAAGRLQELIDDLLAYTKAGRGELPEELLDARRVVDTVIAGLGSTLAASGGRVTVGSLPREVVVNRLVLTQVLHNLVANGLKFVQPGQVPTVHVEATTSLGITTFRVSDNGVGIAPADHLRIFEPFTRLHSRNRYPGSGIGLAICQRLVARQGGLIRVESQDVGTTFVVEIPS
jgi:signal transduction histidine kinase